MFSEKFIKATHSYATYEKAVHAPYLRKTFSLEAVPKRAVLTLTCTGFYRLFVNGTELTKSLLAPAVTNPDEILFYDTYDITPCLRTGKNVLGFWLGNGFSNSVGGYIWDFDTARFRSAPKLAFCFNSPELSFEADGAVRCHASPITFDDLRSGEHYDARLEIKDWNLPDLDDTDWAPAIEVEAPRGILTENNTDPIVISEEQRPRHVMPGYSKTEDTGFMRSRSVTLSKTAFYQPNSEETGTLFAFENNIAALPRLRIKGKPGQKIVIQAAEHHDADGRINYQSIASFYPFGFAQRDIYICSGNGEMEEYIPSFTYHGARCYLVMGLEPEQVTADTLTALKLHSDLTPMGDFSCSDEVANKLVDCAKNSLLSNFVYFPTDCPHREKNGWTGDAAISAEYTTQLYDAERSYIQWLKQIAAVQKPDGSLPGIVPTTGWGFRWGNGPLWDQVLVELPYRIYQYRGSTAPFAFVSDAVMRYLNYISKIRTPRGTVDIGLGDYAGGRSSASDYLCPEEVSSTAVSYRICRQAEALFRAVGMDLQARFASNLADELYTAFRRNFIDFSTMAVRSRCQTAQAVAIVNGLFTPAEEYLAYGVLRTLIHEEGDFLEGGMMAGRLVFRLLAKHGDAELAWRMIMRADGPTRASWVVKNGLSSLAESNKEVRAPGADMSLNHHWQGDFVGFYIAHVAGLQINPDGEGPEHVRIAPNFIEALSHAKATYRTVCGVISVSWQRVEEHILLTVEKPEDIYGEIILPSGYQFRSKQSGGDHKFIGRKFSPLQNDIYIVEKI